MMQRHGADISAIAGFIAGGGLAGVAAGLAVFYPAHATQFLAASGIAISIAGLVRVAANPTPTNSVTLTDRATGSTVQVRTVDAPTQANTSLFNPPAGHAPAESVHSE